MSLDVVALFTNIPKQLVKDIINEDWHELSGVIKIPKDILLEIMQFCFDSSYLQFNGAWYQQLDGSSMGNPASPILANIVMDHILKKTIKLLPFPVPFLKVYVDDTILSIPKDKVDIILDIFNSVNKKIQFTMEIEKDNMLPFLDVVVIRTDDGLLLTDWYVKPTSSGKCLNYYSNHPLSQKISIIKGFVYRSLKLSSEQFHKDNLLKVESLLKKNNYPTGLIHSIFNNYNKDKNIPEHKLQVKKFIRFPFINPISNQINKCFNKTNIQLVFYNLVRINSIYSRLKDKVDKEDQSGIVYRIPCECSKSYVGQTKQKFKKRLDQHKNDCKPINILKTNSTALADHHFKTGHNFKFDMATILDIEENWFKRNISEMIHIKRNNTVNLRTDTNNLSNIYNDILNVSARI